MFEVTVECVSFDDTLKCGPTVKFPSTSPSPSTFKFCPIVADFLTPNPPADVIVPVVLDVLFVVPFTARPAPIIPDEEVFIVDKAAAHLLDA